MRAYLIAIVIAEEGFNSAEATNLFSRTECSNPISGTKKSPIETIESKKVFPRHQTSHSELKKTWRNGVLDVWRVSDVYTVPGPSSPSGVYFAPPYPAHS